MTPIVLSSVGASAAGPARALRWRRPLERAFTRVAALPRAVWLCAALATLNAVTWSLLTPPFQVPDEPVHAGYAEYVGETAKVPRVTGVGLYWDPPADARAAFEGVPFGIAGDPTWSSVDDRALQRRLAADPARVREGGAGYAANNPPLYYALLAAVPYQVARSGTFLDRLQALRIGSALLAGVTVALLFLFLRELLPGTRWAWTVGALAVAFQPLFGFVAGGVNNDNLLWLCGAALLLSVACAFRRGLTPAVGAAIGGSVAAGVLTKGSMFGLLPGAALALILCFFRAQRRDRRVAAYGVLAALVAASVPIALWLVANAHVYSRPATTTTSGFSTSQVFQWRELASYAWQFYLPRLPFMTDQFPNHAAGFPSYPTYPLWQTYVQGFVGRFGWFQFGFPDWANAVGLVVYTGLLALATAALARARGALRRHWAELLTFATLLAGLAALINLSGYQYRLDNHANFEQTRYLLPLIGLYGLLVAVAARGVGRRLGPAVGVFLVVLAVGHNVFAQLRTLDRYYLAPTDPVVTQGTPPSDTGSVHVKPARRP